MIVECCNVVMSVICFCWSDISLKLSFFIGRAKSPDFEVTLI